MSHYSYPAFRSKLYHLSDWLDQRFRLQSSNAEGPRQRLTESFSVLHQAEVEQVTIDTENDETDDDEEDG